MYSEDLEGVRQSMFKIEGFRPFLVPQIKHYLSTIIINNY